MKAFEAIRKNKALLFGIAAAVAFILILNRSDIAIEYMKKGLKLCAATVIPSLFPFMVISELIISSGVGMKVCRLLSRPMRVLFGVSEAGGCAFILGAICGFPIGARTAASMYDNGIIEKKELERLLTFCNNPGSAFVISAIGVSLFGNRRVGVMLYICVILSAVIVGVLGRLFFGKENKKSEAVLSLSKDVSGVELFTSAIQNSALSMLTVCAYVAFFSSFVGCLGAILTSLGVPDGICALIFGFFELSSGVGMAAEAVSSTKAILLCAAFAGWSGLSVHFQIMTICAGRGISFKPFFIAKAAQGVICALLMGIFLRFFSPFGDLSSEIFTKTGEISSFSAPSLLCLLFFGASVCPIILNLFDIKKLSSKNPKKFQKRS